MKLKALPVVLVLALAALVLYAEEEKVFDGLYLNLGNLCRLSHAQSRSMSPENFTGEKGKGGMSTDGLALRAARDLGQGWKVSPYVKIPPKETFVIAEIDGSGAIQQIWMTPAGNFRFSILRFYWDGETEPSVEVPVGDFFACGWGKFAQVTSLPVCVNPGSGFNCYWAMPFRKSCKITMENLDEKEMTLYYQVNYTLTEVPEDAAYFHAQFRRTNPVPYKEVYTIVDGIRGWGHFVGTYMCWGANNTGWWGEGEIKFYLDGDGEFPTICGTGTEDYFGGSYDWEVEGQYVTYTTPFLGMHQVVRPDGTYRAVHRHAMYRWHVVDPIRFEEDI
ncbi:MAG: glycoside hydrolase family 172 protein, partial [Candidatus Aminicenantaceae bacterium]